MPSNEEESAEEPRVLVFAFEKIEFFAQKVQQVRRMERTNENKRKNARYF